MKDKKVKLEPISGFPEWLPAEKIIENRFLKIIQSGFEKYSFSPIETCSVERSEILTAKGTSDNEIYALKRLSGDEDDSRSDLSLHFDLTVPLARYVSQNYSNLTFPFRRYQIQKVWRGERPQSGRFREFYQCDIDVIGDGQLSLLTDSEIPSVINEIFTKLDIGKFCIGINNRKILQGLFEFYGISNQIIPNVLRIVDKLDKIGEVKVKAELMESVNLNEITAKKILEFITFNINLDNQAMISYLQTLELNQTYNDGVSELQSVLEGMRALEVPEENFKINCTIARGLDYYTGTVYETRLVEYPEIGAICSGGRYEDLASYFMNKKLPGVGISIGLTRLLSRLMKAGIVKKKEVSLTRVMIASLEEDKISDYFQLATLLRESGINTEVYYEPRKLAAQLKYANKKGFLLVIIAGETELKEKKVQIKNMDTGDQFLVPIKEIPEKVKSIIS